MGTGENIVWDFAASEFGASPDWDRSQQLMMPRGIREKSNLEMKMKITERSILMRLHRQRIGLSGLVLLLVATTAWAGGATPQLLVSHRDGGENSDPAGIFSYNTDGTSNGRWDDCVGCPSWSRPATGIAYDGDYVYAHRGDHTGSIRRYETDGTYVDDIVGAGGSYGIPMVKGPHIYVSQQDPVRPILRFNKATGAAAPSAGQTGANFTNPSESPNNARSVVRGGAGLANILVGAFGNPTQGIIEYDGTTGARVGGATANFVTLHRGVFATSGDPDGNGVSSLFVLTDTYDSGGNKIIEYSLTTGALLGDYAFGGALPLSGALTFDNEGILYQLVPGNNQIASVGPGGGNLSVFRTSGAGQTAITFIPEPATLALLSLSGLTMLVRPRRRV